MGVAVQSHRFSVGSTVPWAEPGVEVVATQAMAEVRYGPLGLALIRAGKKPKIALRALLAGDELSKTRQVAMMDAKRRMANYTSSKCGPEASVANGKGFSAQANTMRSTKVWGAMASALTITRGTLAQRSMSVLEAAEKAGGTSGASSRQLCWS